MTDSALDVMRDNLRTSHSRLSQVLPKSLKFMKNRNVLSTRPTIKKCESRKPSPVSFKSAFVSPSMTKLLCTQSFEELARDLQKYVRCNMVVDALRVLSEMLHRDARETLNRIIVCALEDIGFENFGLCLVVMQCLMGLAKKRLTPALLCGLIKLMCASPKTAMVAWLCEAYTTE